MNERVLIAVRIDPAVLKALHNIKAQDGIPVNEQIRRAIDLWLEQRPRPEKKSKK